MKLRLTPKLIEKLQILLKGETMPYSQLNRELADYLIAEGALRPVIHGQKRSLRIYNPEIFKISLSEIDEALSDLDYLQSALAGNAATERSVQVQKLGNSKGLAVATCYGFFINSYHRIECKLMGQALCLPPQAGSYIYITDWESFAIPADTLVIGVENMENFHRIAAHGDLFEKQLCEGEHSILFVSRYPQSAALRSWLLQIPNRYVHFGDFDLAGISIFLNEFHKHLPSRSSFLIPEDILDRLPNGSRERYNDQYERFHNISSTIPSVQSLITSINHFRRAYDQEGYIIN